uniref:Ig-like domain-containing protein n=1 Tax=Panagrolaimus sp. JU765 TaxID=591449 RepID=A0AC34R2J0_9BILA
MIQHLPDGTVKLVIKNAKPEDVGTYTVEAFNPAGKVKSEAPLKFAEEKEVEEIKTEPSEPVPRFEIPLQPQTIKPGQTAIFEAKVAVYSQPQVQWFKDDKPIQPTSNLLIEQRPDGTLKLTIQNAKPEDVGNYRVTVATKAGKVESEAPLKYAEEKPVEEMVDETQQIKPLFIHPLKTQAVKEGENVTFECKINETSHPQIQWYRDNVPIDTKPNLLIEHRPDGTLRLTIKKVKSEDIGNYRCEAVNKVGKAETEAPLKYAQLIDLKIPGEELEVYDEEIAEEPQKVKVIQDKSTAAVETIAHTRAEYVVIQ